MSLARVALLISLLAVPVQWVPAQQPPNVAPAATQSPATPANNSNRPVATIHATAHLVILDVVVTDGNGNPVKGLKPSDFVLSEDGVPQYLASFTEHVTPGNTAPASPLAPNTFTVQPPPTEDQTKTIIVLADSTYWDPLWDEPEFPSGYVANTGYVRNDIAAFLKTAPSTQPVAIVRLDWQGMHLVQGLTADRDLLMQAIASKRMEPPLGFVVRFARAAGSPAQQLGRYINSIPGRVNLVFITYGGGTPLGQMQDDFPDIAGVVQSLSGPSRTLRLNRVATYIIPLTQFNVWANSALEQMARAAGGHVYSSGVHQALTEIAATGSDYYTVSYVPTNPDWKGAFRKIKVSIAGFPQPPPPETGSSFWSEFLGWTEKQFWSENLGWTEKQKSKILYRPGYFARSYPDSSGSPSPALPGTAPAPASTRRMISYSPKGDPNGYGAATASPLIRAMFFGTLTPDQIRFTIVTTPSLRAEKVKLGAPLPKENFLTPPFRTDAYRNIRIHYWIDPQALKFTRSNDWAYEDTLQFVVVIYRDDGVQANSLSSNGQVRLSAEGMEDALTNGITYDQTIAVPLAGNPVPGNFFLRVGVNEASTGHIGSLEIPAEWIKLPPQATGNDTAANPAPANPPH